MTSTSSGPTLIDIQYHEIAPSTWTDSDIKTLCKRTKLPEHQLRLVLKWNILTISQVAMLSKKPEYIIRNNTKAHLLKSGELVRKLTIVTPFLCNKKPIQFVLVDDIARNFIMRGGGTDRSNRSFF